MFSNKATNIDEIFTVDMMITKGQLISDLPKKLVGFLGDL